MFTMLKTGSAHSILRCLPLLDNFQEESEKLTYVIIIQQVDLPPEGFMKGNRSFCISRITNPTEPKGSVSANHREMADTIC
jgi:hypothetical protein